MMVIFQPEELGKKVFNLEYSRGAKLTKGLPYVHLVKQYLEAGILLQISHFISTGVFTNIVTFP
jgi:hypothetical protein